MFSRWATTAAVILLAHAAIPQELAPDAKLLLRLKQHLRDELAHVPNYTCLETISRFRNDPSTRSRRAKSPLDTIRLEIVYADHREWFGSPGAVSLNVDNPVNFIGSGMIGNGSFALMMHNLVEGGIFTYRGAEAWNGHPALKYDFRIPSLSKPMTISLQGGTGTVGEDGSIWVDPQSLDVIRMDTHATDIPPYLLLQEATMSIDYARTRIAGTDTLLAQESDTRMVDDDGVESYNRIAFTHCHSYTATSAISFDTRPTEGEPVPAARGAAAAAPAVPPFLEVTIQLTAPISDKDAVGSLIAGTISGNVLYKGKVVLPNGSLAHGRIRAVDRYPDLGAFAVGLEFMDVEVNGASMPFYADLIRLDKNPRIAMTLSRNTLVLRRHAAQTATRVISQPELPGVASFFVKGAEFTLPAGFRLMWRTRGILHE